MTPTPAHKNAAAFRGAAASEGPQAPLFCLIAYGQRASRSGGLPSRVFQAPLGV